MATITYRTSKETKDKLTELAAKRQISVNKTIDLLVSKAIEEQEAYSEFEKRAAKGDPKQALDLLYSKAMD